MAQENVLPAGKDTILVISGMGSMLYQARGLTQTLSVVGEAKQMERTVNGTLLDLSAPQFRKYESKIDCSDVYAAPLDGIWPGMEVTVDCALSLAYLTGRAGSPERDVVPGSSWTEGNYTFYRPRLTMLVQSVDPRFDEWKCQNGWSMDLVEK